MDDLTMIDVKIFFVLGLFILLIVGCTKTYTVEGRVLFEDGMPLTVGSIVFEKSGGTVLGQIDSNGYYKIHGVLQGEHKIYILGAVKVVPIKDSQAGDGSDRVVEIKQLINEKYRFPDQSGISCVVRNNMTFDFIVSK
ncbi:MAG: hypothetical protein LBP59_17150 [Planctomycetaceae bacterium]|jgi:hypothetical protein|nr:hypothetical protein [Planctomycetaceae bacterium]